MTLSRFAHNSEGLVVWWRVIFNGKEIKKYPEYGCPSDGAVGRESPGKAARRQWAWWSRDGAQETGLVLG